MLTAFILVIAVLPYCSGCGVRLSGESGYLHSPNYPKKYANNISCTWNITVPNGRVMILEFHDFDLEDSRFCDSDSLTVINHEIIEGDPQRTTKAKYCGTDLPPLLLSSQQNVTLVLNTDSARVHRGFNASFTALKNPRIECDQEINASRGEITSPYYPAVYPSSILCTTEIIADKATYTIKLTVHVFETELGQDILNVYDAIDNNKRIGHYSGTPTMPNVLTSTGNRMTVVFQTDHNRRFKGFRATYEVLGIEEDSTTDVTAEMVSTDTDSLLTNANTDEEGETSLANTQSSGISTTADAPAVGETEISTVDLSTSAASSYTYGDTTTPTHITSDFTNKLNDEHVGLNDLKAIVPVTACTRDKSCKLLEKAMYTDNVLRIDKAQTSRARRRKVSADNDQPSAKVLGGVALVFMIAFFSAIALCDLAVAITRVVSNFSK